MAIVATADVFEASARAFNAVRFVRIASDNHWNTIVNIPAEEFLSARDAAAAIDLVEAAMRRLPAAVFEEGRWLLSIPAVGREGFAVDISGTDGQIRGSFGGLEEEFATLPDALVWVRKAFSGRYQLRIVLVDGKRREWNLEPILDAADGVSLASGHPVAFRRFRNLTTEIRRNSFAGAERDE